MARHIVLNKKQKTYQLFEPGGQQYITSPTAAFTFAYEVFSTTGQFSKKAKFEDYKFVLNDECPMLSVQEFVDPNIDNQFCQEKAKGGYCVIFSTLMAHMLLLCPNSTQGAIENAILKSSPSHLETMDFMRRYVSWIESVVPKPEYGAAALEKFDNNVLFYSKDWYRSLFRITKIAQGV